MAVLSIDPTNNLAEENERLRKVIAEYEAITEHLVPAEYKVVCREGGGEEAKYGTLALSVSRMASRLACLESACDIFERNSESCADNWQFVFDIAYRNWDKDKLRESAKAILEKTNNQTPVDQVAKLRKDSETLQLLTDVVEQEREVALGKDKEGILFFRLRFPFRDNLLGTGDTVAEAISSYANEGQS